MNEQRSVVGGLLLILSCVTAQAAHPPTSQPWRVQPSAKSSSSSSVPPLPSASAPGSQVPCQHQWLEPFEQPLVWRTAYRGAKPAQFHFCPTWSHFGKVRPAGKWHRGVDLAAPTGTPVHAAIAGQLSYARDPTGWGLFARLRFRQLVRSAQGSCTQGEEFELLYAHLLDDTPTLGMGIEHEVNAGEVLGRVGCSGNARGMCSPSPESHVHVSLRSIRDHHQRDPLSLLSWTPTTGEPGNLEPCPR